MRIEDIDDQADGLRKMVGQAFDGQLRIWIAAVIGARRDVLEFARLPGASGVKAFQTRPRDDRLDGSARAVVGERSVGIEHELSPLAGDAVATGEDAAMDHDSAADARAENDTEDGREAARRTEFGLGESETIRVVGQEKLYSQAGFKILLQGLPVQCLRIGVFEFAGVGIDDTGSAHADLFREGKPGFLADHFAKPDDLCADVAVTFFRLGGDARTADGAVQGGGIEDNSFDFRSAEIDPPEVRHNNAESGRAGLGGFLVLLAADERGFLAVDDRAIDGDFENVFAGGEIVHEIEHDFLENGPKRARSGAFADRLLG